MDTAFLRAILEHDGAVIAHASDLLSALSRSRWAGEAELARILETIGGKVGEPADQAFIYEEDDRGARWPCGHRH